MTVGVLMRERWLDDDKLHDECGIFGVFDHPEAANLAYLGLYALQHRGQESAGIAASDGVSLHVEKAMGWVSDVFGSERLRRLPGRAAIGHVRYSTSGSSTIRNAQPISASFARGTIALGHNGNLVNAEALRKELESQGAIFQSTSDSEVMLHLLARADRQPLERMLAQALGQVTGAYSLVMLTPDTLVGCRDPHGFRPLVIGRLEGTWLLASETCALDLLEARVRAGRRAGRDHPDRPERAPVGQAVSAEARAPVCLRVRLLRASRHDPLGPQRLPGPEGSRAPAGRGASRGGRHRDPGARLGRWRRARLLASESGIPFELGLIRNHYVGRTFIEPKQAIRHFGVRIKLNPMRETIAGRRVVVVDDSIVRGTTSRKIVKMVHAAGAREVHVRISSPPIQWPCYYGIDTPTREELIGASHRVEEIRQYLGADSLGYLSLEGMVKAAGGDGGRFCHACFSGDYQVGFPREDTSQLVLFAE